ncbi:MAG: extracellular solute-binding protein [Elusimicrobiota bacterium]
MSYRKELHFWVMPNAGFATRAAVSNLINEFEQIHPEVKVQLSIHPWSLAWNQLMDVVKGRSISSPDVIQVGTTWTTTLSYLNALDKVPSDILNSHAQAAGWIGDSSDGSFSHDLFGVPWFTDIRVLYYRRDIFEKMGIKVSSLEDWKGLKSACQEIHSYIKKGETEKIKVPLGFPGQKISVQMHDLAPWVWGAGGEFIAEETKEASLTHARLIEGCVYYFDLINDGLMPIPNNFMPEGNFFTGHAAMQLSGSWPVDTCFNPQYQYAQPEVIENVGIVPLPSGPKGRFTFLGGSNLSVLNYSKEKDLAWQFIQFMSEPERLLSHARNIGALPAHLSVMDVLFERFPWARNVFWDSFSCARRLPKIVELGSVEQILAKMGGRVLSSIRDKAYSLPLLQQEIAVANHDIKTTLSIHRYRPKVNTGVAA